jgi:hypothetical protein
MAEQKSDRVHPESVVLDIGQDIGALIIYTDAELRGREIEVSPLGSAATRVKSRSWNGELTAGKSSLQSFQSLVQAATKSGETLPTRAVLPV